MSIRDLLGMSLSNLWRRRLRSVLTVLGVLIGTASITVMMSIAVGQSAYMEQMIASSGGLTQINVRSNGMMGRPQSDGDKGAAKEEKKLNDDTVELLKGLPHVEAVMPELEIQALAKFGPYEAWLNIQGITETRRKELNLHYAEGGWPENDQDGLPLVIGPEVNYSFRNPKKEDFGDDGFWRYMDNPELKRPDPPANMYKEPVFVIYDTEAYWAAQNPDPQNPVPAPKKYMLKASGILKNPNNQGWFDQMQSCLTDLEALKREMKRIFKGKPWPGQPKTKTGRATGEVIYSNIIVRADDLDHTKTLAEDIRGLGFSADGSFEYIENMQKDRRSSQLMLGGIGAISLFVAAIGIANTMMMSIYERTREIGVFKVLGCSLQNIRTLFLMEAGFIGLIGGVLGLILSFIVSFILNMVSSGMGMKLSIIPFSLAAMALVFATLIGMISGLMPALRAMRLSPLEALRTQ